LHIAYRQRGLFENDQLRIATKVTGLNEQAKAMQNHPINIHHHYVPKQLIEQTRRHGKALENNCGHDLSFAAASHMDCSPRAGHRTPDCNHE
jgi:hypothetical protein